MKTPTTLATQPAKGSSRTTTLAIATALLLTGVLVYVLYLPNGSEHAAETRAPLPVATVTYAEQEGYQRPLSFLGLVRADQESHLGFELGGAVAELMVKEGSRVSQGDPIAVLDTSQLTTRRAGVAAEVASLESELELANLKATRQGRLQQTDAVSKQAYDETRLSAKSLEAQLDAKNAQLRSIEIDLEKSILRAPYDGVVGERFVNKGVVIAAGAPVVSLVASAAREAHIGIAVEQAAQLTPGENYTLMLRSKPVTASFRAVRPDVDPNTLTTRAVFDLPSGINAYDGEPITLLLAETVDARGAWMPISALIEGEKGIWNVLRLDTSKTPAVAVREVVEVLTINDDKAFVRGTLVDSQQVIADGVHRVTPGVPVLAMEG